MNLPADVAANGIGWDEQFLSVQQSRKIVDELDFVLWRDSTVIARHGAGDLTPFISDRRTSESSGQLWFGPRLMKRLAVVENRICDLFSLNPLALETWQALRYAPGGKFEIHHDGGVFGPEPSGERVYTFLLYLHSPKEGGQTYFPALDLLVPATAGKLLVWNNLLPDGTPNQLLRHAATPVRRGRKLALTTWSRQRPIRQ